jgi:hypothetical protein
LTIGELRVRNRDDHRVTRYAVFAPLHAPAPIAVGAHPACPPSKSHLDAGVGERPLGREIVDLGQRSARPADVARRRVT